MLSNIIISILIIIGIHYIWNYLKDNYSKKQTKDLVNIQIDKYKKMIDEIQHTRKPLFENETEKQLMHQDLIDHIKHIKTTPDI
jgi:hypothetical protein